MKERPIIYSGESVRAILEGRKTQTRRIINKHPIIYILPMNVPDEWVTLEEVNPNHGGLVKCRFGIPGDRLWVRETWALDHDDGGGYMFKADGWYDEKSIEWRSPIYMPRKASRITLEIVSVRVERVQDIGIDDIYAEGCPPISSDQDASELYEWYSDLWDSLNIKRGFGWDVNPWVWVIEFKRVEG